MDDVVHEQLSELLRVNHKCDGSVIVPNVGDLNLMHWNINHLTNKLNEVEMRIASFPGILHLIAISETWLTIYNYCTYRLKGYREIHSVRVNRDGGGISIFAHESICAKPPKILVDIVTEEMNHFLIIEFPSIKTTVAVNSLINWNCIVWTNRDVYLWVISTSTY